MPNKYVNKVVIGKETKLDLTADTVTPDKLAKGITAHDKSGAPITGTSTKDADTSDATAAVAEVLNGKTFYARGAKMTGTMPNNGEVNGEISTVSGKYTIPMGFHDGAGGVTIAATEQAKLVPANIREGVTVLGVFLSTLSLRRATAKVHKTVGHFCAYETNFMGIASSC